MSTKQNWTEKLWSFFSSMKTGLILLAILGIISGIGTFIDRDIYGTFWFKLVLGLLCINLVICSISRFNNTYKRSFRPQIPRNELAVPRKISCEITETEGNFRDLLYEVLRSRGYRVQSAETADGWSFAALKHNLGYWGSFITHIAFVILIIGAMMGSFGFSGNLTALAGDSVSYQDIQYDKGSAAKNYRVRINSIEDRFLSTGERDNWYTDISIIQEGKELTRGTLSVNHPFVYDGVYYYQSKYMDYANISVEINGKVFEDMLPLGLTTNESMITSNLHRRFPQKINGSNLYVRGLKLQNQPVVYLQISSSADKEPILMKLTPGQSESVLDEYKITLTGLMNATGLKVKADPGVPVVWMGCALLLLGLAFSFYWRPFFVSGLFRQHDQAGVLIMGMSVGKLAAQNEEEFRNITKILNQSNKSIIRGKGV